MEEAWIWGGACAGAGGEEREEKENDKQGQLRPRGFRARLERGDAVFIPKGWWHAVRGVVGVVEEEEEEGAAGICASVGFSPHPPGW